MRHYFFSLFLIFHTSLWSQIKLEIPKDSVYFYANMSYGSITNSGSFTNLTIKNNGDSRLEKLLSIDMRSPTWNLMAGVKYKQHAFELGYGILSHHSGGQYIVETAPEKLTKAFSTVRSMNYVPFRYYYQFPNISSRISAAVGVGLGVASFSDDGRDFVSDPIERNLVEYFPDGKTFSIYELTDEEQLKRSTLAYELNGRLNWQIGKRLGFNFDFNYIYSPKTIRKTDFSIVPQIGKTHSGTINSNLTSSMVSVGVKYYISKPPPQIEKRSKNEIESRVENKNHFYIGSDVGYFYNGGNFKGNINTGILRQSLWGTSTYRKLTLNIGYRMPKYALELSYQKLNNFNDFVYEEWKATPQSKPLILARDDGGISSQYFAMRLYRSLHDSHKWRLYAGAGIALAQFSKNDASEDFQPGLTSSQFLQNDANPSVNLRIDYNDFKKLRKTTWCLEGNLKAERILSKHWQVNFWTRYIYNPQTVRTIKFDIKDNKGQNRFGETSTSLSSFAIGTGLSYTF